MNVKTDSSGRQGPDGNEKTLRAFIAFKLPDNIVSRIMEVQEEVRSAGIKARWVKPENIHLTIKFLGDIEGAHITNIDCAMERAAAGIKPMRLGIKGVGVFPNLTRARVIWIGLTGETDPLAEFHRRLETRLEEIGFPAEQRKFSPHLTIGRFRKRINLKTAADVIERFEKQESEQFTADRIILYKSLLQRTGPVYTELLDHPFEAV